MYLYDIEIFDGSNTYYAVDLMRHQIDLLGFIRKYQEFQDRNGNITFNTIDITLTSKDVSGRDVNYIYKNLKYIKGYKHFVTYDDETINKVNYNIDENGKIL